MYQIWCTTDYNFVDLLEQTCSSCFWIAYFRTLILLIPHFRPVSAYALFFRDTQAAIKGQNPSASFGEVSKIVASMWDGLDPTQKEVQ